MIYLDAVSCIYAVESPTTRGQRVRQMLGNLQEEFCVSQLVLMECLVKPLKIGDVVMEQRIRNFIGDMTMLEITPAVFDRAAHIRATTGLKTPDALHLATAIISGCDAMWTGDTEMAKRSGGFAIDVCAGL